LLTGQKVGTFWPEKEDSVTGSLIIEFQFLPLLHEPQPRSSSFVRYGALTDPLISTTRGCWAHRLLRRRRRLVPSKTTILYLADPGNQCDVIGERRKFRSWALWGRRTDLRDNLGTLHQDVNNGHII
jgi:hypothetical protein